MNARRCFARARQRLEAQDGFALVLALGVCVVLGATATAAISYAVSNSGSASRSNADQIALALAEAGLNDAYATLYGASNPTLTSAVPPGSVQMEGGTASWYGTLSGSVWTLTGVGTVRNPTGPGTADVVRTVSGRAQLGTSTHGSANNAVWNYVYADSLTGCTTIGNSVEVNVPFYVRGNLCMSNSATVTGYALQVGGTLTLNNSQTSVGSAGSPVHEAHVGGGCSTGGGTYHTSTSSDRVFATILDNQPTGLTKPPVDLAGWYQNAMPGPRHGCTSGSFPGGFDNDTTMNRSLGTVDLAPKTAYDCTVRDASGAIVGRIAWTPGSPGSLIVQGTIFFDGNIVFSNLTDGVYQGRGTIYSSGTISLANQTTLCGVAGCGANWDPSQNLLAFVAGSSTDAVGVSIANNSTFQGAVYAVDDYSEGNSSKVWGPIIARQVYLSNSTSNFYVPIGTLLPGMPSTTETALTVTTDPASWG